MEAIHISSRGTYRIERRLLEDPLKPYIAPIRCLPSFHIAWEYSTEPLPIVPPMRTMYPPGFEAYGWYGAREPINDMALRKLRIGSQSQPNFNAGVTGDVKVKKKRRTVKTEDKRRDNSRRKSSSPPTPSNTGTRRRGSTMPAETSEDRPRVKLEPVVKQEDLSDYITENNLQTTIIKQEPTY